MACVFTFHLFAGNVTDTILHHQATVATDRLIGLFVKLFSKQPDVCISTMIMWILGLRQFEWSSEAEFSEDSPFDKGEMNMYFETVTIARLIKTHLQDVLSNISNENLNLLLHFPRSFSKESNLPLPRNMSIRDFLSDQVVSVKSYADGYVNKFKQSIFLCRDIDAITIELYKRLVIIQIFYKYVDLLDSKSISLLKLPIPRYYNPLDIEISAILVEIKSHNSA